MNENATGPTHRCVRVVGPGKICGGTKRVRETEAIGNGAEKVTVRCAECGSKQYHYERGTKNPRAHGLRALREAEMDELGMDIREWSLYKAREWKERYGSPPVSLEWNLRGGRTKLRGPKRAALEHRHQEAVWPSTTTVLSLFGSWNSFLGEAGLDTVEPGHHRRGATNKAAPQSV